MNLAPLAVQKFFGNDGEPLVGGLLFTYVAGTTTKIATYTDSSGATPNSNPVVLDFRGECNVWLDPTLTYKFVLSPKNDTDPPTRPIWSVDNITAAITLANLTQLILGTILWPPLAAEAGLTLNLRYPYGDVRRYGVVANSTGAASANVTALRAALDPLNTTGITGNIFFPNITGADLYSFNAVVPMRRGISIDGMNSTVDYTGTTAAADNISGLFMSLGDFTLENITMTCHVNTVQGSSGYAVCIGARGTESGYFTVFDSTLPIPMGNIVFRNVRINLSNTGANLASTGGIQLCGGLQGLTMDNVVIDGGGNASGGVVGEFGWATSGTTNLRQTSHGHNIELTNVTVKNLSTAYGYGLIMAGFYSVGITNLYVSSAFAVWNFTPGESLFYRPWVGTDQIGAKRTVYARNVVGQGITGSALGSTGQQLASGGYLAGLNPPFTPPSHPADYIAETDLLDITVENFVLDGTSGGYGIDNTAGKGVYRNGRMTGFLKGINCSDEAVSLVCDALTIIGSASAAIALDFGNNVWVPARLKKVEIRNSFFAGGSTASPGSVATITVNGNTESVLIENNRFGHALTFDGISETTQGENVFITSASAKNVICRANTTQFDPASITGGNVAYHNTNNTPPSNGHLLDGNTGTVTYAGLWDGVPIDATITLTAAVPGNLATTYSVQTFRYIKRNQHIAYTFRLTTVTCTHTTASGIMIISGLPYAIAATVLNHSSSLGFGGLTKAGYTQFFPYVQSASALLGIEASGSGVAFADVNITDHVSGTVLDLRGSGHYFTNS